MKSCQDWGRFRYVEDALKQCNYADPLIGKRVATLSVDSTTQRDLYDRHLDCSRREELPHYSGLNTNSKREERGSIMGNKPFRLSSNSPALRRRRAVNTNTCQQRKRVRSCRSSKTIAGKTICDIQTFFGSVDGTGREPSCLERPHHQRYESHIASSPSITILSRVMLDMWLYLPLAIGLDHRTGMIVSL